MLNIHYHLHAIVVFVLCLFCTVLYSLYQYTAVLCFETLS